MILLSAEKVYKGYSERQLLDGCSLAIGDGEKIGLIGINGTGKSTLLKVMAGIDPPDSGIVTRAGGVRVAYLPQNPLFDGETTVLQQVMKGVAIDEERAKDAKVIQQADEYQCKSILNQLGLGDYDQKIAQLSGGQKRRVAIAGVLAMEPDILVLDEPTAGLDPKGRDEILGQISHLQKETGISVVLVSHSMEDVANYVERIIVMNKGKVMFDDVPHRVFSHVKELEAVGLAAPQVTYILHQLKDNGFDVDPSATTIEEAKRSILRALEKQIL